MGSLGYNTRTNHSLSPGSTVSIGFHPSNVVITKLKLDNDRKALLERKRRGPASDKGKITREQVAQS